MKSNLTLQINSLEALERLIGGDSKVEIEIRNSIVERFTKKYLKGLVENKINYIDKRINKEIQKNIGIVDKYDFKLNPSIEQKLNEKIEESINKAVGLVYRKIDDSVIATKVFDSYNQSLDKMIDFRVKNHLKQKLDEVFEKIKHPHAEF